jgi:hypothetical protein
MITIVLGLIVVGLLLLLYRQARVAEAERGRILGAHVLEREAADERAAAERTAILTDIREERQSLLERIQRPEHRPLPASPPDQEPQMPRDTIGMAWVGKEVPPHMAALVGTSYGPDEPPETAAQDLED